jgi:hypothetical protein
MVEEGTCCTVSGWGLTEDGGNSDVLKQVNLPITNNQKCIERWGGGSAIGGNSTIIFCAGGTQGKDSCNVRNNTHLL